MLHFLPLFDRRRLANTSTPLARRITLAGADGGTDVPAVHEGLPPGLSIAENEAGWRMALSKLAVLVEAGSRSKQ